MTSFFRSGLLLAPILLLSNDALAASRDTVLATCTDLKGRIFQTNPNKGWGYQRLKGAVLTFIKDRSGKVDIVFNNGLRATSLRRDGATLRVTHSARDYSYFLVTAIWQSAQVGGFQVTFLPNGKGRLVWNSLTSHMPPSDETKAAMLTGSCTR